LNLAYNLERSAFFFPDRPAVIEFDRQITYKELNERANQIATALIRLGVNPHDRIGIYVPNSSDWIAFYFGILKIGAIAVTFPWLYKSEEVALLIRHTNPKMVFTKPEKLEYLRHLKDEGVLEKIICDDGDLELRRLLSMGESNFKARDMGRRDVAAILFTGGTTGTPKGAQLTHEGIYFSSWSITYYERSNEEDRALCFLPFNHVFGQIHIMNATILSAGCLELLPSFDMDKVLWLMERGRITKFFAVPTIYVRLLRLEDLEIRIGKLRYCFSAAASLPVEIVTQWKKRTGITISESYGMTEAMPVSFNHYYKHVVGSVGQIVHCVEAQIRDQMGNTLGIRKEGEICIRGPNVMNGYYDNPEANETSFHKDGFFKSGDLGYFDEQGYLYIVDRIKELIITGGENVYPREVEEVLYTREEIEECSVIGLPDKEWGERVTAVIKIKEGKKIVEEELKNYLKSKLASYKVPKQYIIVNELPKSPAGKILRRELREKFTEKQK
jgi:long-chain acyl-CoA synthetase